MAVNGKMVRDLIHKLGGPSAVAAWCGKPLKGDTVTAWGLRNRVPWKWRPRVRAMAEAKGIKLTAREDKALSFE